MLCILFRDSASFMIKKTVFFGFLASMIKWFRLQAVKVVEHLIDSPMFLHNHTKSQPLNRFRSESGFFKYAIIIYLIK